MNRLYVFLIAAICSPGIGVAQQEESTNNDLRLIKPEPRALVDSIYSKRKPQRAGGPVFDTFPMPNTYQEGSAVAMPNAYRSDNCVPMPNAYQDKPNERIIVKLDSVSNHVPDSLFTEGLDKLRDALSKRRQEKQRLEAERP